MSPSELRKAVGRRVLVEGELTSGGAIGQMALVRFHSGFEPVRVPTFAVKEILAREIQAGSRVRWDRFDRKGRVEYVCEDSAWVFWDDGKNFLILLSSLTPLD